MTTGYVGWLDKNGRTNTKNSDDFSATAALQQQTGTMELSSHSNAHGWMSSGATQMRTAG